MENQSDVEDIKDRITRMLESQDELSDKQSKPLFDIDDGTTDDSIFKDLLSKIDSKDQSEINLPPDFFTHTNEPK